MKKIYCIRHKKSHTSESGWRYTKWDTKEGIVSGWGCAIVSYPEMVPERIKNERVEYANDMLQSHRGGMLSREFLEAHPTRAKQMLQDGAITKEEIKKSTYVWKADVKGVVKKVDAESLIR